ncbi:DUF4188 domain-containing protein [Geomicrobium sp. JCM 19039]|uniref:DUF4188 domain-containing protein n=1 Tax=Geomicrobium sp. JCM 19039 TaxID=1460636 RepID=UPI00045F21C7|nr:DUF4188 domain-containing protein [Geomicrobium sp. JCM 19039]GAK12009.1 hypothetical protein JCM19039_1736 [Geomicrobium sp. JCM 19039]
MQKRVTADHDGDIVVFIIGMRVNKWWNIKSWWPVFMAMPPMMKELYTDRSLGFLSHDTAVSGRTIVLTQYWESTDQLLDYAHGHTHKSAWIDFYKKVAKSEAVGVFHETYDVRAGAYESVYSRMGKPRGIVKATAARSLADDSSAKARLHYS